MTSSLGSLLIELQHLILGLLLPLCDELPRDLSSVSKVNKHLRRVAEPLLYSEVYVKWDKKKRPSISPIIPLLRTVLNRPEVASYIQVLCLGGDNIQGWDEDWDPCPPVSVIDLDMDKASKTIERTKVKTAQLWMQELRAGSMDAVAALLLSQTLNLKCLRLQLNYTPANSFLGLVARAALLKPSDHQLPKYQRLSEVAFSWQPGEHRPEGYKNTQDVLPFFYLPELRHFSVAIDNPIVLEWPSQAPICTTLESLDLHRLREVQLVSLLSTLKGLKRLAWEFFYQDDPDVEQANASIVQLDKLAVALNKVSDTLTDLTITAFTGLPESIAEPEETPLVLAGSLDGFIHLRNLRRLEIPWVFLMGPASAAGTKRLRDGVPVNTETLVLTEDLRLYEEFEWGDEDILTTIEEELEFRRSNPSGLQHLSLQFWYPTFGLDEELIQERARLELKAAKAGIQLVWPK
ncbi:hypothetical protein F66182_8503 [Fusarium sp. NRRL 66182]|nr:hypothetical protein F66182_8503 [Fusarium sp. NRRL 66182]